MHLPKFYHGIMTGMDVLKVSSIPGKGERGGNMKKLKEKIRVLNEILFEIMETLISICMFIDRNPGGNQYKRNMYGHARRLAELEKMAGFRAYKDTDILE